MLRVSKQSMDFASLITSNSRLKGNDAMMSAQYKKNNDSSLVYN